MKLKFRIHGLDSTRTDGRKFCCWKQMFNPNKFGYTEDIIAIQESPAPVHKIRRDYQGWEDYKLKKL